MFIMSYILAKCEHCYCFDLSGVFQVKVTYKFGRENKFICYGSVYLLSLCEYWRGSTLYDYLIFRSVSFIYLSGDFQHVVVRQKSADGSRVRSVTLPGKSSILAGLIQAVGISPDNISGLESAGITTEDSRAVASITSDEGKFVCVGCLCVNTYIPIYISAFNIHICLHECMLTF
jgi:hypothetical protein